MEAVVGLLLMLLGVSHGLETYCDGRKDGAQCYGALGGTVNLQLMDSASEIFRYELSHESTQILIGRRNDITSNRISSRSVFTPSDGTFMINDLSRNDSGEYKLLMFNSDGQNSGQRTLHLSVQAPVSFVLLVSECLQGEMKVSCFPVEGDKPQYRWTLDGRELTNDDLLYGNTESEIITLKANVSGYLVCSVRNGVSDVCGITLNNCISSTVKQKWAHVSSDSVCIKPTTAPTMSTGGKETHIVSTLPSTNISSSNQTETCGRDDPCYNRSLLVSGLQAGGFILAITVISIYFTCKRKKHEKAESSAVSQTTEYPQDSVVMVVM